MNSCFDFARRSFDVADRFQTPVFVAMDLDLGMNLWSSEPLKLEKEPYNLGKRLSAEQLEEWAKAGKKFRRYFDQEGDGIPTEPYLGTSTEWRHIHPRFRPRRRRQIFEDENDYKYILDRLRKKFETARKFVPKPIIERKEGSRPASFVTVQLRARSRGARPVKGAGSENQPYVGPCSALDRRSQRLFSRA
jgi:2-oxoglutarate ferredoxin oxidoreductase subunit alpha